MLSTDKKQGSSRSLKRGGSKKYLADFIYQLTPEEVVKLGKQYEGLESPIDISFGILTDASLPPMEWVNFEEPPRRMKISNSGTTAILSAKWNGPRPYLTEGPLNGNYIFSQLHFHWGCTSEEGSEHTLNGKSLPLEVHLMFFKNTYMTQEEAMKKSDGTITVAYFFTLQGKDNENFNAIISGLNEIQNPRTSYNLELLPLTNFLHVFNDDYFMYWGSVIDKSMLWIISRTPLGISLQQLSLFHSLRGVNDQPIARNCRSTTEINHRLVFHVNPSKNRSKLLLDGNATMAHTHKSFRIKKSQIMMSQVEIQNPFGKGDEYLKKPDDINLNVSVLTDKLSEFIFQKRTEDEIKECNSESISNFQILSSNNPALKVDVKRNSQIKFQLAKALMNLEKEEGNDYAFLEKYLKATKVDSLQADHSSFNIFDDKRQVEEMHLSSTVRSLQINCNLYGSSNASTTPIKEKSKSDTHCLKSFPFLVDESHSEETSMVESNKTGLSDINSFSDREDKSLPEIEKGRKQYPSPLSQRPSTAKLAGNKDAFHDYRQNRWNRKAMLRSRSKISTDSHSPLPTRTNSIKSAQLTKNVSGESSKNRSFNKADNLKPVGQTVDEARDKIRSSLNKSMSKLLKMRSATADAIRQKVAENKNRPAWRY